VADLDRQIKLTAYIAFTYAMPPIPTSLEVGTRLLDRIWFAIANNVVERAIRLYEVEPEKAAELRGKFLKSGDYVVQPK
jgi:hypothetical protein